MNTSSKWIRPALLAFAIALALGAQWIMLEQRNVALCLALYLFAIGVTVLALLNGNERAPLPQLAPRATPRPRKIFRALMFWASMVCAVGAFTLNADSSFRVSGGIEYQFTLPGVIAWVASIGLFLSAFWQPAPARRSWRAGITLRPTGTTIALLAILALGAFFYFYRLDTLPAEMNSDHAEKLLDVNDILEGHTPVFFNRNTGREPLQFYITAALIKLTGVPLSHLALKLGTALLGWLTIPWTFLLAREMFDDTVGLLAAFFVATLRWPVTIARMGLRYPFTPFFAAASLYYVWRAIKYHQRNDFLLAGFWIGFGLLGYIPSRNVPLIALGILALYWVCAGIDRWRDWKAFAFNSALLFGLVGVIFMPLLRFSLDYPDMFWYRALTRVASAEKSIEGNIVWVFARNLVNLAEMFHYRGDEVWVTNVNGQPTLDFVTGGLLLLGVVIAIYRAARANLIVNGFLLTTFVALLLPSALALAFPRENPSLVRTGGAIPLTAILIALPLASWVKLLQGAPRGIGALKGIAVGAVLLAASALNYQWYFEQYAENYRNAAQNSTEAGAIVRGFVNSVGDFEHAYYIGYPHWMDGRAIAINAGNLYWDHFTLDAAEFIRPENPQANLLYLVHRDDAANLQKLQARYPTGQMRRVISRTPGKDFIVFFVPASPAR